ncbi:cyclic nucleotide-binding domain-containing protein [Spirillospora sp. NPDC029432]|uniref:cyclic nucleotide-binding domain-containing protein n=1 Tax=Spirillospora sp. NPDC029432 TaxID=3154599 RepID=UPI0034547D09
MGHRSAPEKRGRLRDGTTRAVLAVAAGAGGTALFIGGARSVDVGVAALVVLGMVAVVAIPVSGYTLMLVCLALRGLEKADSSEDVTGLMQVGAAAFTMPLATLLRGKPVRAGPPPRRTAAVRPSAAAAITASGTGAPSTVAVRDGRPEWEPEGGFVPNHTFWAELTPIERGALAHLSERMTFPQGTVLCQKDQPADRVIVIRSGVVRVTSGGEGDGRELARRGPGDILGERAMQLIRERSATVIAMTPVRVMVASAAAFNAFLDDHPRVVEVLERQIYDRLTRSTQPESSSPDSTGPEFTGQYCPVLFVDVVGFSAPTRTDRDRLAIRRAAYAIMEEAFDRSGIAWADCHREDRGDGILVVVPPAVPAESIVDPLAGRLAAGLARHNRDADEAVRFRLRAALDVGPVTSDPHGVNGYTIIRAARLLDAPAFKQRLAASSAHMGFIVSEPVYDSVVKHAPGQVDPAAYVRANVRVKEARLTAWTHLPAGTVR